MHEHPDEAIHLPAHRPHGPARPAARPEPAAAREEGPPSPQLSPKFLFWVFTKSWRVVAPIGVLLAGAAASALLYSHVPMYKGKALLQIERNPTFIVSAQGLSGNPIRTQVEMIRQPFVLRRVLKDRRVGRAKHLAVVSDKVGHIQDAIEITQVGGSDYYELSYESTSPSECVDVLEAVIQEYLECHNANQAKRTKFVIESLTKLEDTKKDEVKRLQQEVISLTGQITGRDPSRNNRIIDVEKAFPTLGTLHGELTGLQVEMEILEAEIRAIETSETVLSDPLESTNVIDMLVGRSPEVQTLENEIELMRKGLERLTEVLLDTASDKAYIKLEEEIAEKVAKLEEVSAEVRAAMLEDSAASRKLSGQAEIEAKRKQLRQVNLRYEALDKRYQAELSKVKSEDATVVKLQFVQSDLTRQSRMLEMISQRKLVLTTEAKAPARISVADAPRAIEAPIESAPWKKLFVACTAALMAPFGLAVLREASLKRIVDAEQLYGESRLRVLGEIATFPTRRVAANPQQLPRSLRREMHAFAESIDALRMSLTFHRSPEDAPAAYAITSAVSSEGKTSVSSALAMSFANASRKPTLLIDGDLRDPSVGELIQLQPGPGLAEVLAGKCAIGEAIQSSPSTENLYVLPAGECTGSPHALVQPRRLRKLIDTLRERFSVIVIDTPPVLGASESLTLCSTADVASVCAMRGSSRVRQLQIATEKLQSAGVELAGSILNGVPTRGYGYAYAYGYGFRDRDAVEAN